MIYLDDEDKLEDENKELMNNKIEKIHIEEIGNN
jgi:hypothetical protein